MARFKPFLPLLLLIVANAWILGGVWSNRAGAAGGELMFDDCAFGAPGGHSLYAEESAFFLYITSPAVTEPAAGDLSALRTLARPAYVLVEQGGPAWEAYVAKQREGEGATQEKPYIPRSDLIYAAAAESADALPEPNANAAGAVILPGYVTAYRNHEGEIVRYRYAANREIAISSDYRDAFAAIYADRYGEYGAADDADCAPRYRITLRVGARFEPWIAAVEPIQGAAAAARSSASAR